MTLRAHLFAASLLGTTSAMAMACSSTATDASSEGERFASTAQAVVGDELSVYAAACDSIMGSAATVPAFDCDTGIDIPVTYNGAPYDPSVDYLCDAPDESQSQCVPHEKLVPIASTATATTVAVCRRFTNDTTANYDAVEVIQHSKVTGDTCFYVSRRVAAHSVPGKAPSPSNGTGRPGGIPYWDTPTQLANDTPCISCHDNGAFIRSPFVKQLSSTLPSAFVRDLGFGNDKYNLNQPYHPYGAAFASWQKAKITLSDDTTCTGCHRMGTNNVGPGTGEMFGPISVACYMDPRHPDISQAPLGKFCGGYDQGAFVPMVEALGAPHWMIPSNKLGLPSGQSFTPAFMASALKYSACAQAWRTGQTLPADCSVQPF